MITAYERERDFRRELADLLEKHGAEMEVEIRDRDTTVVVVSMWAVYEDYSSSAPTRDFCEFDLKL